MQDEFVESFSAQTAEVKALCAKRSAEQEKLMREIEAEKQQGASLPLKHEKLAVLESDREKLCDFVEKLKEHIATLEAKVAAKGKDLAAGKAECDAARERVKELRARVQAQELSAEEAQRMVAEKDRLEKALAEAVQYHAAMRQKAWEADLELTRKAEELERGVHSYTAQATALQLLPRGSKNAQGADFRIGVHKETLGSAVSVTDVLATDVGGAILPALRKFKELVGRKLGELKGSAALLGDAEEQSQEQLEEAADRLEALQVPRHSHTHTRVLALAHTMAA